MDTSLLNIVLGIIGVISLAVSTSSLIVCCVLYRMSENYQSGILNEVYRNLREDIYGGRPHNPSYIAKSKDKKYHIIYDLEIKN